MIKKGDTIMNDKKKMYEKPSMRVVKLQTGGMLAASPFGAKSVTSNVGFSSNSFTSPLDTPDR